jgi:lipoprotein-releasing system permease protein
MTVNTPFFIAKRYLFSKEKKNFINIITLISVFGVAIATMALVVILSVFNGLEDLLRTVFRSFDPDLKVLPIKGKSFVVNNSKIGELLDIEGVLTVNPIVEDNALLKYEDNQLVVKFKGVPNDYFTSNKLDSILVEGKMLLSKDSMKYAIVGRGVHYYLNINLRNEFVPMQLWYPKLDQKQILDPEKAFNRLNVLPSGVFAVEKQFDDNYVFLPINDAIELMGYGNRRSYLELKLENDSDVLDVKQNVQAIVGDQFVVLDEDEQHASLMKAIKVEKSFVFVTFMVIIAIAALNILFSLTLTAIEKKKDVALLKAIGASSLFVRKVFVYQGFMIGLFGTILGLSVGYIICVLQKKYGFISMGMESALVDAYPIRVQWLDFVVVGLAVFLITLALGYKPALEASKQNLDEI